MNVKSPKVSKHWASKKSIKGIKVKHVKNLSRGEQNHLKFLEEIRQARMKM